MRLSIYCRSEQFRCLPTVRSNILGLADLFCLFSAYVDLRLAEEYGHIEIETEALEKIESILATLEEDGEDISTGIAEFTPEHLVWLLETFRELLEMIYEYDYSGMQAGSEHILSDALEGVLKARGVPRLYYHGDKVTLCTVIMARLQGQDWKRVREVGRQLQLPVSLEGYRDRPGHRERLGFGQEALVEAVIYVRDIAREVAQIDLNDGSLVLSPLQARIIDRFSWFNTEEGMAISDEEIRAAVAEVFHEEGDELDEQTSSIHMGDGYEVVVEGTLGEVLGYLRQEVNTGIAINLGTAYRETMRRIRSIFR